MSTIDFPFIVKQSKRFKRYSWNQVVDKAPLPVSQIEGGKNANNAYLGPSWDDEAGALPTSAATDDMDFDLLLSQVQTRQSGKPPLLPGSEQNSASHSRKKKQRKGKGKIANTLA
ncbi:hypothetical protein IWW38_005045 [Coemansia aciculifera]|uniref:Uncharacterized protein n=1 Tax=Coemansia aciculifera TaxID=417176 RepID=A0ACC1LWL5_9FUNG|nr:hypothetical protein IWW38_005045 [Coemansia aciculifera]